MRQISGFIALQGIPASDRVVDAYKHMLDPADRGVRLVYDIACGRKRTFDDTEGDPLSACDEIWRRCNVFRVYTGLSLHAKYYEAPEWYLNPDEHLLHPSEAFEAQAVAEVASGAQVGAPVARQSTALTVVPAAQRRRPEVDPTSGWTAARPDFLTQHAPGVLQPLCQSAGMRSVQTG